MNTLEVCVGSSCHVKGSYDVIAELKRLIAENSCETQLELKGCFCLGQCRYGVSLRYNGMIYTGITKENIEDFFIRHVKVAISRKGGKPDESHNHD